ncbi:MAG: hypothetical protein GWN10_14670 [Nitrospinaceae bacterium]|nr:hypothetical protein [Nitrospinaceae bacterium]NIX35481.1 hypothetical protein [Nitrospinaceae bacterium]
MGETLHLVGGTVRDYLLNKNCKDYDFTGRQAPAIARAWAAKVRKTLVPLDETPGHETFRVMLRKDLYFDFTTLQGNSIHDDLAQRDFTLNAMSVPLSDFVGGNWNLIDPFHGEQDIANRLIRVLPGRAFEEDPLRLLRAFRFAAILNFNIEPHTLKQIEVHKKLLSQPARERVNCELMILLGAGHSNPALLDQTGIAEVLFPGIASLKSIPGFRAGTTAWTDTLNSFLELESLLNHPERFFDRHEQQIKELRNQNGALLKWSALAGPLTEQDPSALTDFLKEYRVSNADIQFIERTLRYSTAVLSELRSDSRGLQTPREIYRFVNESREELIPSLLLALAVRLGRQVDIKYFIETLNRILDFNIETYIPARDRPALLDGQTLKKKFRLSPSPLFKTILDRVEEERVLGTIHTPEEAERLAETMIKTS